MADPTAELAPIDRPTGAVVPRRRGWAPREDRFGWLRDPYVAVPAAVIVLMLIICFPLPAVVHLPHATNGDLLHTNLPAFSPGNLLGTDPLGRNILARCLLGGRQSLEVAGGAVLIGLVLGSAVGVAAVFGGALVDGALMRLTDMLIAFPALILFMVIADGLGPSVLHVIFAICAFTVPAFARMARGAAIEVRGRPFVLAHEVGGCRRWRMVIRHIVPNIMPQLVTFSCLLMGVVILVAGALGYLGLGVPPPAPSWGSMINDGQSYLNSRPSLSLIPSGFLFVTVVALNLLADGLRRRWGQK